jgi:hypothetical protein
MTHRILHFIVAVFGFMKMFLDTNLKFFLCKAGRHMGGKVMAPLMINLSPG